MLTLPVYGYHKKQIVGSQHYHLTDADLIKSCFGFCRENYQDFHSQNCCLSGTQVPHVFRFSTPVQSAQLIFYMEQYRRISCLILISFLPGLLLQKMGLMLKQSNFVAALKTCKI